jgi:hypothetical protein
MKYPRLIPSGVATSNKEEKSFLNERRRHIRYRPKEGTFAAIGPNYELVGRVRDISRGGLCFTYFDFGDEKSPEQDLFSNQIDIYMLNNEFNLRGVRCVIVNNEFYIEKNLIHFSGAVPAMKRCGIRFESVSLEQEKEITRYLLSMTCGVS